MDKRYEQKVKTKVYKVMTEYSTSHFPTHQTYKIESLLKLSIVEGAGNWECKVRMILYSSGESRW